MAADMDADLGDYTHERHYTVEQAEAARPWVAERVARIQAALEQLRSPAARAALDDIDATTGGAWPGRTVATAVLALLTAAEQLEAMDIVLRDADRGLVDFPSIRDGEEVYLCWQAGEPRVAFWHDPDAGFAGRQPL
jgi:Uncharacterized conserved protein (DUF2203)